MTLSQDNAAMPGHPYVYVVPPMAEAHPSSSLHADAASFTPFAAEVKPPFQVSADTPEAAAVPSSLSGNDGSVLRPELAMPAERPNVDKEDAKLLKKMEHEVGKFLQGGLNFDEDSDE